MMKQFEEIFQGYDVNDRKLYLSQYVVMLVVCHDIARIGCNGTVNKLIVALEYREPYREIRAMLRDALNKAVCIENYSHTDLYLMFFSLLFAEPLMKVHLVDFVKAFLVKDSFIPEFTEMVVQFLCIVVADDRLQLTKFLFTFVAFEHSQQMELNGVEYRRFRDLFPFVAAKISINSERTMNHTKNI